MQKYLYKTLILMDQFVWQLYAIGLDLNNFFGDCTIALDKIARQMEKFSVKPLYSDRSVCMAAICIMIRYHCRFRQMSSFLMRKGRVQNFDISKTERCLYRQTDMAKAIQLIMLIIYIYVYILKFSKIT